MLEGLTSVLRWAWPACQITLLILLWRRKLLGSYRWFAVMIATGLLQQIITSQVDQHARTYAITWAWFEFAWLGSLACATLELTRKIMEHYPDVANLAVAGMGSIFCFGSVAGTFTLAFGMASSNWLPAPTYIAFKILRWEGAGLFAYLFSLVIWFSIYPLAIRRNVRLHRWLLAVYGGALPSLALILIESDTLKYQRRAQDWINAGMMCCEMACLLTWCVFLTPAGEQSRPPEQAQKAPEKGMQPSRVNDGYAGEAEALERLTPFA